MKKYKLMLCGTAYIEISEKQLKTLETCTIDVGEDKVKQGVQIQVRNMPYDIMIITPLENLVKVYEES